MNWSQLKPLETSKLKAVDFPRGRYFEVEYPKKQIILHHTVSNSNSITGDISQWLKSKDRVGTCMIVSSDGTPHQCFPSKYWAYHSTKGSGIDKYAIGVEFDSWGPLVKGDGNPYNFGSVSAPNMKNTEVGAFYAVYGNKVNCEVVHYPNGFRFDGQKRPYYYFEKYTDAAIQTVGELLLLWKERYGIPLDYNADMWEVSPRALAGHTGVWSHTSFIPAPRKSDCHPQPELIEMLKTLNSIS